MTNVRSGVQFREVSLSLCFPFSLPPLHSTFSLPPFSLHLSLPSLPPSPLSLPPSPSLPSLPSLPPFISRSMQELQVKFEPPDIMGVPPEPLPIPLFSGDMFSTGTFTITYKYMYFSSYCVDCHGLFNVSSRANPSKGKGNVCLW